MWNGSKVTAAGEEGNLPPPVADVRRPNSVASQRVKQGGPKSKHQMISKLY